MCIGVGMYTCMYANQLVQTKTKLCKSAIILKNVVVRIYLTFVSDPGELYLIIIQYILVHPKCIFSICLKVSVVSADITVSGHLCDKGTKGHKPTGRQMVGRQKSGRQSTGRQLLPVRSSVRPSDRLLQNVCAQYV